MILEPEDGDYAAAFIKEHQREFSFTLPNRKVLVENLRIRGRANGGIHSNIKNKTISSEMASLKLTTIEQEGQKTLKVYFEGGWTDAPLFVLKDRIPGDIITGPAMIYDETQMVVVQPGATARFLRSHVVIDLASGSEAPVANHDNSDEPLTEDPIKLSIMSNRFMGIAEQMGLTLQKTSVSVNIKERLDFSCALFGVRLSSLSLVLSLTTLA